MSTENLIDAAIRELAAAAPHDPDLAGTVRRRSRWRRMVLAAPVAAALAVIVGTTLLVLGPWRSTAPTTGTGSACAPVATAVLPSWARAGFTDPEPQMPYVRSADGHFVAIIFGTPLSSPPAEDHNNKILWVADSGGPGDLVITGTNRTDGTTMSTVVPGGPGPSIVDMPSSGCWHLDLAWGSVRDSIDLSYVTP